MLRSFISKTDITDYAESIDSATKSVEGNAMMVGAAPDWVSDTPARGQRGVRGRVCDGRNALRRSVRGSGAACD